MGSSKGVLDNRNEGGLWVNYNKKKKKKGEILFFHAKKINTNKEYIAIRKMWERY